MAWSWEESQATCNLLGIHSGCSPDAISAHVHIFQCMATVLVPKASTLTNPALLQQLQPLVVYIGPTSPTVHHQRLTSARFAEANSILPPVAIPTNAVYACSAHVSQGLLRSDPGRKSSLLHPCMQVALTWCSIVHGFRSAYLAALMQMHPDNDGSAESFQALQQAYKLLSSCAATSHASRGRK